MDSETQQTTVIQETLVGEANVKETGKSMETPTSWSELPIDMLRSVFSRLALADFHRAKIVCSSWHSCSKVSLPRKSGPWLFLSLEDGDCAVYNPEEDRVYRRKRVFSGTRIQANVSYREEDSSSSISGKSLEVAVSTSA
ncbi:hypothetical protein CARUB_v10002216mg [Capsella rubella]|uniref:F-box domain-containing protein n=1 Tax=Capsella rubella TaxID=81985 RepID=R0H9V1_9BRAS|nr:hypothetical protein CARUB_v10002216mg [Capsella rubella]